MPDYIAAYIEAEEKDLEQHGVKGQRWGVRRSSAALRAAAKSRGAERVKKADSANAKKAAAATPAKKPDGNIQDHVESSSARYDRLSGQAKAGRAHEMTEQDLKFFNARTEALSKVAKLNETKPGWLGETTKKVIQQSAQRQMQTVADAIADKYIGDPLKNALTGKAEAAAAAATKTAATKTVAAAKTDTTPAKPAVEAAKKVVDAVKSTSSSSSAPNPSTMRFAEAIQYYKDNPDATPQVPEGYSRNAQKIFFDEVAKLRKS